MPRDNRYLYGACWFYISHFYCWVCVLVWCLQSWGRLWSVYEVVLVRYVDAVVAVTVICELLFVLHVCIRRVCEADANAVWGCVVAGRAWCEYMGVTRG